MLPWATIAALSRSNPHLANSGEDVLIKVCSRTTIVACVSFSRQEGGGGERGGERGGGEGRERDRREEGRRREEGERGRRGGEERVMRGGEREEGRRRGEREEGGEGRWRGGRLVVRQWKPISHQCFTG